MLAHDVRVVLDAGEHPIARARTRLGERLGREVDATALRAADQPIEIWSAHRALPTPIILTISTLRLIPNWTIGRRSRCAVRVTAIRGPTRAAAQWWPSAGEGWHPGRGRAGPPG